MQLKVNEEIFCRDSQLIETTNYFPGISSDDRRHIRCKCWHWTRAKGHLTNLWYSRSTRFSSGELPWYTYCFDFLSHKTHVFYSKFQLPRHYLQFPDGYVLVYDPNDPASLDMLAGIKSDIDKNKDKKEVSLIKY